VIGQPPRIIALDNPIRDYAWGSPDAIPALLGPGVLRVIHQRTLHLGPDEVLLAAKLAMPADSTLAELAAAINAAEARVRTAEPSVRVIYLEPDLDRGPVPEIDPAVEAAR